MMKHVLGAQFLLLSLLAGCGKSGNAPATPTVAAKPDVSITIDAQHQGCVVSKADEPTGSTVACAEVVAFIRDELRVRDGSSYAIRQLAPTDEAQAGQVRTAMDGAGFRFVGAGAAGGGS